VPCSIPLDDPAEQQQAAPALDVIVVSWNVRDWLALCLRSLRQALENLPVRARLLVVDNASTDGSVELVQREFPEVGLLALPENQGFATAVNQGLRALGIGREPGSDAGQKWLLLLNADTEIVGSAVADLLACGVAHPEAGVVGPRLISPDGTVQSSRRRFPTPATLFWESTVLEQYFPRNRWARRYRMEDQPDDILQEVDWLVGACLLVRARAIADAGWLDEGYFLYFEELEWCQRVRRAGWRVLYLPTARVIHHGGKSSEQVPLQQHLQFQRSKVRYTRHTFGPGLAECLRLFLLAMYAWKWATEAGKLALGHRPTLRRERMGIYAALLKDGLRA